MAVLKLRAAGAKVDGVIPEGEDIPRLPDPTPNDTAVLKARTATYSRKPGPDIVHEEVRTIGAEPPKVSPKRGRPKK